MTNSPQEDYGLKVFTGSKGKNNSKDRRDMAYTSATPNYSEYKSIIVTVNANPYTYKHGLGYIPKIIVNEILSDHNRKLPYDDGTNERDFSYNAEYIKIRGVTSGTFEIIIYGQGIL